MRDINCLAIFVVYMITCKCGHQYIGRTIRLLCTTFLEHKHNIKIGVMSHSLPKNVAICQNRKPECMKIMGLEHTPVCPRG
ncbi:hypothetical protein FKM82_024101 [Ascaphus truei]